MNIQICDYCGERWPKNNIKMTRRPNNEDLFAELCDKCIDDILKYTERVDKDRVENSMKKKSQVINPEYNEVNKTKPKKHFTWK